MEILKKILQKMHAAGSLLWHANRVLQECAAGSTPPPPPIIGQLVKAIKTYDPHEPEDDNFTFGRWFPQSRIFAEEMLPFLEEAIVRYVKDLPEISEISIADIGGGVGVGSEHVRARLQIRLAKEKEINAITVNMSLVEINRAYREWCEHFSPKVTFCHADIFKHEKIYDFIISSHVIEHVEHPASFVLRMQQLAKKNVFIYAPYREFPLSTKDSGHINMIDDDFVRQFNPVEEPHIIPSTGFRQPDGTPHDCVFFALPGKAHK